MRCVIIEQLLLVNGIIKAIPAILVVFFITSEGVGEEDTELSAWFSVLMCQRIHHPICYLSGNTVLFA